MDGGFCDSGDPLDFTVSEVRQVIAKLTDRAEAAEAKLAETEHRNVALRGELLDATGQRDALVGLRTKLADEVRHADALARVVEQAIELCEEGTMPRSTLGIAPDLHAARRAGTKEETR